MGGSDKGFVCEGVGERVSHTQTLPKGGKGNVPEECKMWGLCHHTPWLGLAQRPVGLFSHTASRCPLPSVRVLRHLVSGSLAVTRGIQVLLVAHGLILRAASSQTKGIVCKVRQLAFPL